ncbi:MAG: TonB-dependent receptor [Bacteroidales bacterium]|nr:TonB-dependent receptor [Bacteroidales bacterium]
MKKILILLATMLSGAAALAQTTVRGTILDAATREGEPYAIVEFFKAGDEEKPIAFATTDTEGKFSNTFTVKGDCVMLFNNLGRKQIRREFTIADQPEIDLGTFLAEDDAELLKGGTVTAQRPLVKMEVDKMTYDVAADVDAKTSTVLDMLRKVPMVSVDGQDRITVNGSSSFQVYVDGKPNQMMSQNASTVFKMMPASAVKNIEVVTNPGVRYDAEGVGGVLNITTNRAATGGASVADGVYGTLTGMASTRGYGGGLFGGFQKGKFALSLNLNAMENILGETQMDMTRVQDGGMTTAVRSATDLRSPIRIGNLSASYEIDTLNLVSVTAGLMGLGATTDGTSATEMTLPGLGTFGYEGTTYSRMRSNTVNLSADYQHLWADVPARSFILSYQYEGAPTTNDTRNTFGGAAFPGFDLTDRRTDARQNSVSHTAQADFTTPLGDLLTVSTGAKFLHRHNSSAQTDYLRRGDAYVENPASSLDYDFYNRIGAAYSELSGNFGTVGAKAGVCYEHTWQSYRSTAMAAPFHIDYGNLVPMASLQYSPAPTRNIGLSYNLRISRPGISYLNPYVNTSDPTARSYGNTDLDAERSHTVSLVFNTFGPKLTLNATLRHSFTPNGISAYSFYDADNLLNTTYGNIVRSRDTGLNIFAMLTPGQKTRIILNGGAGYTDLRSATLRQSNAGWNYNAMLGVQQTLPADFRLSANLIAAGRSVNLQGWSSGISLATLGLTRTFLDDRLSVSLNGISPLAKSGRLAMESHTRGNGFTTDMSTRIPLAQATLNVSWTFGRQGTGAKRARRTIENESQLNATSTAETMGSVLTM